jgi:hypothetical protein
MTARESQKPRRPYQKPRIEQIRLSAGEVLLVACKGDGSVQPFHGQVCHHIQCRADSIS